MVFKMRIYRVWDIINELFVHRGLIWIFDFYGHSGKQFTNSAVLRFKSKWILLDIVALYTPKLFISQSWNILYMCKCHIYIYSSRLDIHICQLINVDLGIYQISPINWPISQCRFWYFQWFS